jgi:hypothetical protein
MQEGLGADSAAQPEALILAYRKAAQVHADQ